MNRFDKEFIDKVLKKFNIDDFDIKNKIFSLAKWLYSNNKGNGFDKGKNFFKPYKPYALLTILEKWENNTILINESFINFYKELLMQDPQWTNIAKFVQHSTDFLLKKQPLGNDKMKNSFFNRVKNNIFISINKTQDIINALLNLIVDCVIKCTNNDELINKYTDKFIVNNSFVETKYRIHQAQWAQLIKESCGNKCLLCEINYCLEAAHIVPVNAFKDPEGKDSSQCYSKWNGLCLCATHHKLFDNYLKLTKRNNEYIFLIKEGIEEDIKLEIESIIIKLQDKINELVISEPKYIAFFDLKANYGGING